MSNDHSKIHLWFQPGCPECNAIRDAADSEELLHERAEAAATESPAGETRPAGAVPDEDIEGGILVLEHKRKVLFSGVDIQRELTAIRSALVAETDARKRAERERDEAQGFHGLHPDIAARFLTKLGTRHNELLEESVNRVVAERARALADASALRVIAEDCLSGLETLATFHRHTPTWKTCRMDESMAEAKAALASPHPGDRLRDTVELAGKALEMFESDYDHKWPSEDLQTAAHRIRMMNAAKESRAALAPFRRDHGQAAGGAQEGEGL